MARIFRNLVVCFLIQFVVGAVGGAEEISDGEWTLVSDAANDLNSTIHETVWQTSRPSGGEYDRIELHRYRGGKDSYATVLYLPGTKPGLVR